MTTTTNPEIPLPAGGHHKVRHCIWSGDNNAAIRGSDEEELMKRAILGVSAAAAAIALAPLCIPPAQAHADDPCVSVTDPAAHQACIDESGPDDRYRRYRGNCDASPLYGQEGQLCRDFWVRKSAPASRHPGADTV
jgi:hypothetical protein